MLVAAVALVASPALAQTRQYSTTADQTIYTLTEPGGVTVAAGTWEGNLARVLIDATGGALGQPRLIEGFAQSQFIRTFLTSSTTGVPGSTASVAVDSLAEVGTQAGTDDATSGAGDLNVTWGPLPATIIGGQGQLCTETAPGGCASAGLPVGIWQPSIPPVSPVDSGTWVFTPGYQNFTNSTVYRYFDLNPLLGVNIYGEYSNGTGTGGYLIPVMAPIGALALAGSLAYMGISHMRRRS
jgi:hypothetical protein